MSNYQPSPNNPFLTSASTAPPAAGGGGPGGMSYQPQPMQQQPSMMMAPGQPTMIMGQHPSMMGMQQHPSMMGPGMQHPSMMGMGVSPYGRKVRCMGICDIVCSSLMIVVYLVAISVAYGTGVASTSSTSRTSGTTHKGDIPPPCSAFGLGTYAISAVGLITSIANIVCACLIIGAANSVAAGSLSKTTFWMCSQVACLLTDLSWVGFYAYCTYLWAPSGVIPAIVHCIGIFLAVQFRNDLKSRLGGGNAVAPMPPGGAAPPVSSVVVSQGGEGGGGGSSAQGGPEKDKDQPGASPSTNNPFANNPFKK